MFIGTPGMPWHGEDKLVSLAERFPDILIDIVGIATDHCVRATALDAAQEGFTTTVLLDLTAAVDPSRLPRLRDEFTENDVRLR